jgi:hypothetical protein
MESKKLCQIDLSEAQPEELGKPVDSFDDGLNPCSFLCLIPVMLNPERYLFSDFRSPLGLIVSVNITQSAPPVLASDAGCVSNSLGKPTPGKARDGTHRMREELNQSIVVEWAP